MLWNITLQILRLIDEGFPKRDNNPKHLLITTNKL